MDRVLKIYFDGYRRAGTLPPLIEGQVPGRLATEPLTLGFQDPQTGARLWGKLDDCIILPDGRLAPLDHKTRASAPQDLSYTQQYYQFQMDVYTLLLERAGRRTRRTAYVVYYFPVEGPLHEGVPFQVAVHVVPTDPQRAFEVFREGCRCLAGALPPSGALCEYCRWAEARLPVIAPVLAAPPAHPARRRAAANPSARPVAGKEAGGTRPGPRPRRAGLAGQSGGGAQAADAIPTDLFA
jgi:hypothetical protein